MGMSSNEVYGSNVTQAQYEDGRKQMIAPAKLIDEFYMMRHKPDPYKPSPERYAIDALVSIENVEDKGNYYTVSYEWAHLEPIKRSDESGFERVVSVQPDGIIFIAGWMRKGFFKRKEPVREEKGYFLNADEQWDELLPKDTAQRPRELSLV
jgi:hypothetical protein